MRTVTETENPTIEHIVNVHVETLPEGVYLATSDDIQGPVAQGRTIQETLEIARDVAKKLLEARSGADEATAGLLPEARTHFDYPLVVATSWDGSPAILTATSSNG